MNTTEIPATEDQADANGEPEPETTGDPGVDRSGWPPTFYVTSALPYVNAPPHVGFALELVITDAIARYHRLKGDDVRALTGTDDNSLKNVRAAERLGVPPGELVRDNSARFRRLQRALDCTFDDFIQTSSDPRHTPAVYELWKRCVQSGDIYRRHYRGLYCVGCEQFYKQGELPGGLCPEHQTAPELVEEENYFFRLSRYQGELGQAVRSDRLGIKPQSRKNEVLQWLESGLEDFSVSRCAQRARGWGIEVPGDPSQVIFVWFDALANYISALGWPDAPSFRHYWGAGGRQSHVIGKGILRFHALYWPAILLSAGVPLPTDVLVHGYVTAEGKKIGKSLGNSIDPQRLADEYGSDSLRYFLLRHIHTTQDGDFSRSRLIAAHNAELADQLGNFVRRALSLIERFAGSRVPHPGDRSALEEELVKQAETATRDVDTAFERFELHEAAAATWRFVAAANRYVGEARPWDLTGPRSEQDLRTVLYHLGESVRLISVLSAPFVPAASARIREALKTPDSFVASWGALLPGALAHSGPILFPKIEPRNL